MRGGRGRGGERADEKVGVLEGEKAERSEDHEADGDVEDTVLATLKEVSVAADLVLTRK